MTTEPLDLEGIADSVHVVPDFKASKDDPPPSSPKDNRARFFTGKRDNSKPRNERTRTYKPAPEYHEGKYVEQLETLYGGIAAFMAPFHQQCGCAAMVASQATMCAQSVDALAGEYPAVRRFLEGGSKLGTIIGVGLAHAPIMAAIATNHTPIMQRIYAQREHVQEQEYARP